MDVREDLLAMLPLADRGTGELMAKAVTDCLQKFELPLERLVSCTTDGAKAMVGENRGCVAMLRKTGLFPNMSTAVHCIIHQENLCSKSANLNNVMSVVQKTVNFIRKNSSLTHRQFRQLLKETEAVANDVILHTEVRWLSRSAVLDRFCDLLSEITNFLESKGKDVSQLRNDQFRSDLFFLADFSAHLSTLNYSLQGKDQLVTELYSHITAFEIKLPVLSSDLQGEKHLFPRLQQLDKCGKVSKNISQYIDVIESVQMEFASRFQDLKKLEPVLYFLLNPFTCEVVEASKNIQSHCDEKLTDIVQELSELKGNLFLKSIFKFDNNFTTFWRAVPSEKFPLMVKLANQITAIWGSTYCCESTFSVMKFVKSKHRTNLSDYHLNDILRIASTSRTPDFAKLTKDRPSHPSH